MAGQIKFDDDAIVYAASKQDGWQVRLADVRVIGEFLNQHGRGRDDYFLVFMTGDEWFKAPFYAEGREAFMTEIGRRLNHNFLCDLFNSTNLSSRILWPAHLEGHALFDILPETRSPNIVTRVRQLLLQKVQMRFTEEVRKHLGRMDA